MFEKKSMLSAPLPANEDQIHTIVGKEASFTGKLTFEGTVRIDGKFSGEVFSQGKLIVGDSASMEGQVEVSTFISSGEVKGEITARSRIELKAPGKMRGNMKTPLLVIDEGVLFEGNCQMENLEKVKVIAGKRHGDDDAEKKGLEGKKTA